MIFTFLFLFRILFFLGDSFFFLLIFQFSLLSYYFLFVTLISCDATFVPLISTNFSCVSLVSPCVSLRIIDLYITAFQKMMKSNAQLTERVMQCFCCFKYTAIQKSVVRLSRTVQLLVMKCRSQAYFVLERVERFCRLTLSLALQT